MDSISNKFNVGTMNSHKIMAHGVDSKYAENYCGTTYAAKLLNLSVGTVQKMVKNNELKGWKTNGGHRRISLQSINQFLSKINNHSNNGIVDLRILVVDDDILTRELLKKFCVASNLSIDCTVMASGMDALLDIANIRPGLLITDLDMPGMDGFELIKTLRKNTLFDSMMIVAMSALDCAEINNRESLPEDVRVMKKPIKLDWMSGFLSGIIYSKKYTE